MTAPGGSDYGQHISANVKELPNGFSITLPPIGLIKGSQGLFLFAVLWDIGCTALLVVLLLARAGGGSMGPPFPFFLILSLFLLIGTIMMLVGVHMGKRRAMIGRVGEVFAIRQIGPFGAKERRWQVADIWRIDVGPSGVKVNNRPLLELQITDRKGITTGFFCGRSEEELRWLVVFLTQRLGIVEK